jgi:hypothetical protein
VSPPTPRPWSAWTAGSFDADVRGIYFTDAVWTGTRFVAIGNGFDYSRLTVAVSRDGHRWHIEKTLAPYALLPAIAVGGGTIVVTGTVMHDGPASWTSPDGLTWTMHGDGFELPQAPRFESQVRDVVHGPDGWVAVGERTVSTQARTVTSMVWTSTDGVRWRWQAGGTLEQSGMQAAAAWDRGYVAVGQSGDHAGIWTSPDARTWTQVEDDPMFHDSDRTMVGQGIAASGDVAVAFGERCGPSEDCQGIRVWTSSAGDPWSQSYRDEAAVPASDVVATRDGFYLVTIAGIASSTEGRRWRWEPSPQGPLTMASSDNIQVAIGDGAFWRSR